MIEWITAFFLLAGAFFLGVALGVLWEKLERANIKEFERDLDRRLKP